MDLKFHDVIIGPKISDKAYKQNSLLKKLVIEVHPKANKPLVSEALEKLFNVKVKDVRILNRKGKVRRAGKTRLLTKGNLEKVAFVTLQEGYSIDLFGHTGTSAVTAQPSEAPSVTAKESSPAESNKE